MLCLNEQTPLRQKYRRQMRSVVILHNKNKPIQIYWKIYHKKMNIFR